MGRQFGFIGNNTNDDSINQSHNDGIGNANDIGIKHADKYSIDSTHINIFADAKGFTLEPTAKNDKKQ